MNKYFQYLKHYYRIFRYGSPNSYRYQKTWAARFKSSKREDFSNEWGEVDKMNPGLGDYRKISNDIADFGRAFYDGQCLDVGCLDGKWATVLARHFTKVHLTDLSSLLVDVLTSKLQSKMGIFYKTKGDELKGFGNNQIDFIFSMDSLVRAPKKFIWKYFSEFYRVLKPNGSIYIHLPVIEKQRCVSKQFTEISLGELKPLLTDCGFTDIAFDMQTLDHGVIVMARKPI